MSEIKERIVYLLKRTDKPYDGTDIYIGSTSQTLKNGYDVINIIQKSIVISYIQECAK